MPILKGIKKDNITYHRILKSTIELPEIKNCHLFPLVDRRASHYKVERYLKIYETNRKKEIKKLDQYLIPDLVNIVDQYL
jgi:hypothetical protein